MRQKVVGGRHAHRLAVGKRHFAFKGEVGLGFGRLDKALGRALFVERRALPDHGIRFDVVHAVERRRAPRFDVGLREGQAVCLDEVGGVGVTREELKVGELFGDENVEHAECKRAVLTRADRNPVRVAVGDVGHARINRNHLGPACAGNVEGVKGAHGAAHRAADENEIAKVGVVGFEFPRPVKALAEHPFAGADARAVAGGAVTDAVRRPERRREPLAEAAEGVARRAHARFAVLGHNGLEFFGNVREGFVPGDLDELALAPLARAL